MADSSAPPSDEAKNQQTRELLFKRHPQLQYAGGSAMSSPDFGGVGTRQFLAKQTPGSVTSASSYEDGASYDGFSEEGTPAALPEIRVRVAESKTGATEPQESKHQPTKRLSSPSRRSLTRSLVGTTTSTHGVFGAEGEAEALDASSSSAASPSTVTRRVLRRTNDDGTVHEEIQYVDAEGNVVKTEGSSLSATQSSSFLTPIKTTVTRRVVTPDQHTTPRRVVTRHTDADGHVKEVVKLLDADGNVVSTEGGDDVTSEAGSTTSTVTKTTPGKTTVTRRVVSSPAKTLRSRIVHRTGVDGKVVEEIQYLDAEGHVVSTESGGSLLATSSFTSQASSSGSGTPSRRSVTRRRVVTRRTGADGKVHEEVQYLDADGKVVSREGGNDSQEKHSTLSMPSRLVVTRRVVSPARVVKRTYVSKSGGSSESGQDSQDEVQSLDDEDTRSVTSVTSETSIGGTPSRRVIKRRVVTMPRHVVRHTVVRKDGSESGMESQDEVQSVDGSEGSFYDDSSRGVSSSRTTSVTQSMTATPDRTSKRHVSAKMGDDEEPHDQPEAVGGAKTTAVLGGRDEAKAATAGSDEEKVSLSAGLSAPALATSTVPEEKKTQKSNSDALRTAAVAGATGVTAASVAKTLEDKEPSDEEAASKPQSALVDAMAIETQPTITTVEKVEVGEARAQGSASESPRDETFEPASGSASTADDVVVTEIAPATVVETEETEYALRMQQAAASAVITPETDWTIQTEDKVVVESPGNLSASAASSTFEEREEGPSSTDHRSSAEVAAIGAKIRESERRTMALTEGDLMEPDVEMVAEGSYVEVASPREDFEHGEPAKPWMVEPCTIGWNNLRLTRENCKGASAMQLGDGDVVLSDVSGSAKAGEFLVITGPSKGESLALLSCLAGYQDAMEGNVTVNGRKWNKAMDRYVAYVQREDLFFETLTVHEHLMAQAQLRMRNTHSDEKCLERVEAVIEEMDLTSCRDKLIGGGIFVRGISRGERKLLALATALLTNPSILLVEEPTDGLDTFEAERIVAKLRHLAFERGLTVAVTLHHPASHFYVLFDVLYLVTESSCVYDGKAQDCVSYFATLGYQCPLYMSPMDYFLIQMVVSDREADEGAARIATLKREWANRNAEVYAVNEARVEAAGEESVVDDYDLKNHYYHMGCCGQLWLLWARHVQRLSRYGFVFGWYALAALVIGVIFGLVYLQLDLDNQQGIQNFAGAFFYAVVVQMLFHAYRTFVFAPREAAIALRERQEYRGSWYYLACWYMTKIVAELPALIVLSILLFAPVFLLVGIGHGFTVYVYIQILIVLAGWSAIALGFLALGVLRRVTLALVVYCVLLILFVVFGGLLINVSDIPDWLIWLHYISPVKYAHEAMMKIFWVREDSIGCDFSESPCIARTGDGVLEYYGMESRSALGDTLILLGICLTLFFVAFWFLLILAEKRINGFQWRFQWTFSGLLGNRQQRAVGARMGKEGTVDHHIVPHVMASKSHNGSLVVSRDTQNYTNEQELSHYIQVETPRIGGTTRCDAQPITLGWSSLSLKKPMAKKQRKNDAEVDEAPTQKEYWLSDASGSAKCGEVVLITGPSDRANVALLESLGGLQSEEKLQGCVIMNGESGTLQQTDDLVAYVQCDELFHETLTVQEHLRFQAQLCVTKGQDQGCGLLCFGGSNALEHLEAERVETALEEMELQTQRHVLIRYLSPADRKLLAIATALLSNPSVLLVEEPTHTGEGETLDFHDAQRVVLKLRQLARIGRTVVVTMAHPSSHVLALFDTLYLLAAGAAVYHGKVSEAVPYFASLGYECPEYESPVDFLARQVTSPDGEEGNGQIQAAVLKEAWSTRYSELLSLQEEGETAGELATSLPKGSYQRRQLGCCGQLTLLFRRHMLRLARYRFAFLWHALFAVVAGVIFGLIFLKLDPRYEQGDIQNMAGALFSLVVLEMVLMAARTLAFLPHELHIAEREHRGGGYYLVCWFVTKLVAEIPSLLALSVIFFVPAYLLIDFGHGFELYVCMQMVLALCGWGAIALTMLALAIFRRMRVALVATAVLLVLFVVFGGLLVNVDDVPDYLIWLHYISPVKFGYESLMKLFWTRVGLLICGETGGDGSGSGSGSDASYSNGFPNVGDEEMYGVYGYGSGSSGSYYEDDGCIAHSGDEVLEHFSMEESERTAQADAWILLGLVVLYFFLVYAVLSLRWLSSKTRREWPRMDSRAQNDY